MGLHTSRHTRKTSSFSTQDEPLVLLGMEALTGVSNLHYATRSTYAWFYDTQMLNADPFVAMAAAAVHTRTIHLGTGVLVPSNRLAPVTANCLASLNKLAPGRIHCGLGTGFTARRAMGLDAVKLEDLAEYIRVVRGLLRQETIVWHYEGQVFEFDGV